MRDRKGYQDVALLLLPLAFIAQVLHTITSVRLAEDLEDGLTPARGVLVGDTVRSLMGHAQDGTLRTVHLDADSGTVTVVYAFHPECTYSDTVAPDWAVHLSTPDSAVRSIRRIALTRGLPGPAGHYAERFGWQVNPLSVSQLAETGPEYFLVSRTPWIFVFDSNGMLRFHDHGSELERVDEAIAEASSVRDGQVSEGTNDPSGPQSQFAPPRATNHR